MRKEFFLVVVFLLVKSSLLLSQTSIVSLELNPNQRYYYAGSMPESSSSVVQKLKIEIFGGEFTYDALSTDTYSINTRNKNTINVERRGGSPLGGYELRVYKNGKNYDFVIQINRSYVTLFVQSWFVSGTMNPVNVAKYDPMGKVDVTDSFPMQIISATDYNGNIGIGTLSPKAKLDVRGTVRAKEVKIEMNAGEGADFVFEQDYSLRPLSEVEAFINENKHLPEVPSEKQMTEDGLDMSKMQIKLLQKIEEMTLYIIQQQKQLDEQDRKNASLEEKIKGLQEIIERKK